MTVGVNGGVCSVLAGGMSVRPHMHRCNAMQPTNNRIARCRWLKVFVRRQVNQPDGTNDRRGKDDGAGPEKRKKDCAQSYTCAIKNVTDTLIGLFFGLTDPPSTNRLQYLKPHLTCFCGQYDDASR